MQLFDGGGVLVERMHNIVTYTVNPYEVQICQGQAIFRVERLQGFQFS